MLNSSDYPCRATGHDLLTFSREILSVGVRCTTEMSVLVDTIADRMTEAGYPWKDVFAVRLACEEATVNAIKHGNQNYPCKQVFVRFHIDREFVLIEVQDEGGGYKPHLVPDPKCNLERPSGRGLLLIQHYASWVELNEPGNCIRFCKYPSIPIVADA